MPVTRACLRLAAIALAACLSLFALPAPARAQSCTFTASDVVLGPVDVLGNAATTAAGNININCSAFLGLLNSMEMRIHLGEGSGGLAGGLRRMTSATTSTGLAYDLFQDPAYATVFGGSFGAHGGQPRVISDSSLLTLLTTTGVNIPIHARVPGRQTSVRPGSYSSRFSRNPQDVRVTYRTCPLLGILCTDRTATFSFNVRAQVRPECLVQADDMDFGTHGLLDRPVDATSQVRVTCTSTTSYSLGLNHGLRGTGLDDRHMRDLAGNRVAYQLYHDGGRTQPWGLLSDGSAATAAGTGAQRPFTIHGRVPAQPTPAPGAYADTVVVTVTY